MHMVEEKAGNEVLEEKAEADVNREEDEGEVKEDAIDSWQEVDVG